MNCRICTRETSKLFTRLVLKKYDVAYFRCAHCEFIQTEEPFWLNEAYNDAINIQDVGLIHRNKLFSEIITCFLRLSKIDPGKLYLDYGGGYGMFVRMMRDNGYNFLWADKFCENLYASKFSVCEPFQESDHFESITTFEVFEHLADPIREIQKLLKHTDTLIFSTELAPKNVENWWYVMPEHGQHVAFYSLSTLKFIANKYSLNLYSNNKIIHILTRKKLSKFSFSLASSIRFSRIYNTIFPPHSLLQKDYELYLNS